jgi:hypothetical protein
VPHSSGIFFQGHLIEATKPVADGRPCGSDPQRGVFLCWMSQLPMQNVKPKSASTGFRSVLQEDAAGA